MTVNPAPAPLPYPETADIETSSDDYARRFAGGTGRWMLSVQERIALDLLDAYSGGTILDVGGGHGQLAGPLCQERYKVTVLGSAESCRRRIVDVVAAGRCQFLTGNVLALPFPDRSFDAVISIRLLTHCTAWPDLARELCRVSRRAVMVDYPASEGVHSLAPSLFGAKKKLEGNTRTWRPFRHDEIEEAFRQHGFVLDRRVPQFFFPMALHRLLHWPGLSAAMEGLARGLGLTRRWGSPVLALMTREAR
jgi:SAM-dependent methyltransferase